MMFKSLLRNFDDDARVSIAIIFSLTLVVIATTIGLAIDVSRGIRAGGSVGAAVDAAVLAGARGLRLQNMTDTQVANLVRTIFEENRASSSMDLPTINMFNVTINRSNSSVELDVDAEIPTTLGQLAGIQKLALPRRSVAIYEK